MNMQAEEEQIQALKQWWSDNGSSLIFSLVLGLGAVVGWNWWQDSKQSRLENSFVEFQALVAQLDTLEQNPGDEVKVAEADFLAQQIKERYPSSLHASFAAFLKAKQAVKDEDFDAAKKELTWVLEQQESAEINLIASLRLAKVHFAVGEHEAAMNVLDVPDAGSFSPAFSELKGDILFAQQRYQDAYEAYETARDSVESAGVRSTPLLETKLGYAKSFL